MTQSTVAILGGGFIGANLAGYLADSGLSVKVLDRGTPPVLAQHDNIQWCCGSIENIAYLGDTLAGCDTVFHLFSSTVPGDKVSLDQELSNNISLLSSILTLCQQAKVRRLVFMSSSSVYGIQSPPISETVAPNPISTHGLQKLAMEHLIHIHCRQIDMDYKILRLANPYGPGQNIYGRQGFIAILLGKILKQETLIIRGQGEAIRDYLYIDDVLSACLACIEDKSEEGIFNIGSGQGYSLLQVVEMAESILGRAIPKQFVEARQEDIPSSILDVSLAREHLGFQTGVSLQDGMSRFMAHTSICR